MAKVLFLADELNVGGVSSFVITLANELSARGHEMFIGVNAVTEGITETLSKQVTVVTFTASDTDSRAAVTRRARKWIVEQDIDVVFFNNCYYIDSYCLKGLDIHGVYVIHGNDVSEIHRFLKEGLYCDTVVAISNGVWDKCQSLVPAYDVAKIAHGTTVAASWPVKQGSPFQITYLGRISAEKGVEKLREIIVPVLKDHQDISFALIGGNSEHPAYEKEIVNSIRASVDESQFEHQVLIHRKDIHDALAKTHVLLGPSENEGFGLSFIEAAAYGAVPVISYLAGVTDEIFTDQTQAFLIDKNDLTSFRADIMKLYADRKLWETMSKATYENVCSRYSVAAMTDKYQKLIEQKSTEKKITRNLKQRAFGLYRHILFLNLRKRFT